MSATQQAVLPRRDRPRLVIAAMLISTFMAAVEVTVISTAMPSIVARLGGFGLFSWAFGIYLLAQAVTTPLYGRLADSYGRRVVYLGSTAVFLAGSLLCGCAWSMGSLILFRAVQGIGGGALVPIATTIIGDIAPPADRPRLFGYVSGVWGLAAILGPLLGALFVNFLGWPFVFWLNLPIGLMTMTMVARFLHEPASTRRPARIDASGAALLVAGVGAAMLALVQGETLSWAAIGGCVVLAALALAGFAWRERLVPEPLLPVHLLRRRLILAADVSALLCGALMIGPIAFLPTWVQGVRGGDALAAGVVLGALVVSWTLSSMGLGRVMARFGDRKVALASATLLLAGSLGLAWVARGQAVAWLEMACVGLGAGLGINSLVFTVAVQSGVARADRGRSVALYYFFRLIGQALGAAAFGGVLNAGLVRAGPGAHDAVRELVGAGRSALPPAELDRLTDVLAGALHGVFALGVAFAVGALLVALLVPRGARLVVE